MLSRSSQVFLSILFVSIIGLSPNKVYSQEWAKLEKYGIGTNAGRAGMFKSTTDKDGNTYAVGFYKDKITFGGKEYKAPGSGDHYFLIKLDRDGVVIWVTFIATSNSPFSVESISVDNSGRVYISGQMAVAVNFGNNVKLSMPTRYGTTWAVNPNFVCAYDRNGKASWAKYGGYPPCVTPNGTLYTNTRLHNGFPTYTQWQNYVLGYHVDSIHCYNSYGIRERRVKGWSYESYTQPLRTVGEDLWLSTQNNSNIAFRRYDYANGAFDPAIILPPISLNTNLKSDVVNQAIYIWGYFNNYQSITVGNITVTAKTGKNGDYDDGFIIKYDLNTNSFAWGKTVWKMSNFDTFVTENANGELYLASQETGTGSNNNIRCYSAAGDSLWTMRSRALILNLAGMGIDRYGNVYITGDANNGTSSYAVFGPLSFRYSWDVAYWAKVNVASYAVPTSPMNLNAKKVTESTISLTWEHDNPDEIGYRLEYKDGASGMFKYLTTLPADALAFDVSNLQCDSTYIFRVVALGKGASSLPSNTLEVTTQVPRPEFAPPITEVCVGGQLLLEAPQGYRGYSWSNGDTTQNVMVAGPGIYSVQVKVNDDCVSEFSDPVTITDYLLPPPLIQLSASSVCNGDSVILTAPEGCAEIHWNTGESSIQIAVTNPGPFELFVVDANNCKSDTSKLEVPFYAYPTATLFNSENSISIEEQAGLFQWFVDDRLLEGATQQSITPEQTGKYQVSVTLNGCTTMSSPIDFVVTALEISLDRSITVSPIPAHDRIRIAVDEGIRYSTMTLELTTVEGKQVQTFVKLAGIETLEIETSQLKPGIYFLRMMLDSGYNLTRKVIIF